MNLITTERVPVTVYRWDDAQAPVLDKMPNCVASIFKACLVTGYGSKQPAGWSMAYEDMTTNVKVLKPPVSPNATFYVRLSKDTGYEMTVQMYKDMTDINTGTLILQCATPYKYNSAKRGGGASGRWMMIATAGSAWFFTEVNTYYNQRAANLSGSHLYMGETCNNGGLAPNLCLLHTGGTSETQADSFFAVMRNESTSQYTSPKIFDTKNNQTVSASPASTFSGRSDLSSDIYLSQLVLVHSNGLSLLPGYLPSKRQQVNYTQISSDGRQLVNHATGNFATSSYDDSDNFYVPVDYWEM